MSLALLPLLAAGCFGAMSEFQPAQTGPAPLAIASAAPAKDVAAPAIPAQAKAARAQPAADLDAEPNGLAFADIADDVLVNRVLAAIEAITTLQSDFTQIAPSGATSTGKFYLRRPGLLRFDYDAPTPLLIVATGGTVFVRDEALETTDSYPVGKTPLKYLLRKRVELGDAKIISVARGEDTVAITFSSDKEETDGQLSVVVKGSELQLKEWIVRDPQNGVTLVTLSNVKSGAQIPNRLFAAPETGSDFLKE
ncbi:MAG: outer membrane lipoprotein carrier protein LolA [Parvularculaceae bacterium]